MNELQEVVFALRDLVAEVKGLREDLSVKGVVVESDADWYRKANNLGEVL